MSISNLEPYIIKEQDAFLGTILSNLKKLHLDFGKEKNEVKFLGLSPYDYTASYYIGLDWLVENESYLMVEPKIKGLDYINMFMHCLKQPKIYKHLKDIYHVDFSRPAIQIETDNWELTPFLIIHFLFLLEKVTHRGLKKNYVHKTENLEGKIKGKINFSMHLKKNVLNKREERIWCDYEDYITDCPENRLLKRALEFVHRYSHQVMDKYPELMIKKNKLLTAFESVSDDVSIYDIRQIRLNPIYQNYSEAIKVGKLILRRFGYSFSNIASSEDNNLPPFWIDMSKLFELYVFSKLREGYPSTKIEFQAHGKYGYVDFLDDNNKIIIDTKYKLCYAKERYKGDDIRQLSGYARDIGILKKLGYADEAIQDKTVVDCVIIAPDKESLPDFKGRNFINKDNRIKQFTKFYWSGIRLPKQ